MVALPVMKTVKHAMDQTIQIAILANKLPKLYIININVWSYVLMELIKFLLLIQEPVKLVMILIVRYVLMVIIHLALSALQVF